MCLYTKAVMQMYHLVEPGHPEICTAEEQHQHQPKEPGCQLAVAIYAGTQQCGQGFAEQHALGAYHPAEQGVANWQCLHPAM